MSHYYRYFYNALDVTHLLVRLSKEEKIMISNTFFQRDPEVGVYKFLVQEHVQSRSKFVLGGEGQTTTNLFNISQNLCSQYHPLDDFIKQQEGLKIGILGVEHFNLFKSQLSLDSINCPWNVARTTMITPNVQKNKNYDFVTSCIPYQTLIFGPNNNNNSGSSNGKAIFDDIDQYLKPKGKCILFVSLFGEKERLTPIYSALLQNIESCGFRIVFTQIVNLEYLVLVCEKQTQQEKTQQQQQQKQQKTDEKKNTQTQDVVVNSNDMMNQFFDLSFLSIIEKEQNPIIRPFFAQHLQKPSTNWMKCLFQHIPHTEVSNVQDCNVIIYPDLTTNFHNINMISMQKALDENCTNKKPIVFLLHDDPTDPCNLNLSEDRQKLQQHEEEEEQVQKSVLIFRTSMLKSKQLEHERICPSFQASDFHIRSFQPVRWQLKPQIGFCGFPTPLRSAACSILEKQPDNFITHFVLRPVFFGHFSELEKIDKKMEFLRIMQDCPYQLCCRGAGNFSHRFYETLAYGRIPIVVTEGEMIFFQHVPQHEFLECVVCVEKVEDLPKALICFHQTHNLYLTQEKCRQLWEKYFDFSGFSGYIHQEIISIFERNACTKVKQS